MPYAEELKRSQYWRDDHPLGITGYRFSVALPDLGDTARFYEDFCGATLEYRAERPTVAGRSIGLRLGDITVDFVAPTGPGPISAFVERFGSQIRSMIFEVQDMQSVRRFFSERGVPIIGGDMEHSIAIVPDQNLGVLFQFEGGSDRN